MRRTEEPVEGGTQREGKGRSKRTRIPFEQLTGLLRSLHGRGFTDYALVDRAPECDRERNPSRVATRERASKRTRESACARRTV